MIKTRTVYVVIFLISLMAFIQCQKRTGQNNNPQFKKVKPVTKYYRLRELEKGNEFHRFSYMYPLSEKDIKEIGDYYKVKYNDYGQVELSEKYYNSKAQTSLVYSYNANHQIDMLKYISNKKLASSVEYKYKNDNEKELLYFDSKNQLLGKRITYYKSGRLNRREIYDKGNKINEIKYEYAGKTIIKKIYKGKQLESTTYHEDDKLTKAEKTDIVIEYFYFPNSLLDKEKHYKSGNLFQIIEYKYNDKQDRIRLSFFDSEGNPHGRWTFINEKGTLYEVRIYSRGKLTVVKKLSYDKEGKLVKEEDLIDKKLSRYYSYFYDKKGNMIKWLMLNPKNVELEKEVYEYNGNLAVSIFHYKDKKLISKDIFEEGKWQKVLSVKKKEKSKKPKLDFQMPKKEEKQNEFASAFDE